MPRVPSEGVKAIHARMRVQARTLEDAAVALEREIKAKLKEAVALRKLTFYVTDEEYELIENEQARHFDKSNRPLYFEGHLVARFATLEQTT